jgi:hypothetical protein
MALNNPVQQPKLEADQEKRRINVLLRYNSHGTRPPLTGMAIPEFFMILDVEDYIRDGLCGVSDAGKRCIWSLNALVAELHSVHGERLMLIQCREWIIRWEMEQVRGITAERIRSFPTQVAERHYEAAIQEYILFNLDDIGNFVKNVAELADRIGTRVYLYGYGYNPDEEISKMDDLMLNKLKRDGYDIEDVELITNLTPQFKHNINMINRKMVAELRRKLPKGTLPEWLLSLHNLPSK